MKIKRVLKKTLVGIITMCTAAASLTVVTFAEEDKTVTIPEGTYYIASASDNNIVVDISWGSLDDCANVQLYSLNETPAQKFVLTNNADGTVTFTNKGSGKAIDIEWGVAADWTNVQQYESNGTAAQKWNVILNEDGTFSFSSTKDSKYVLDVFCGNITAGSNVQIYSNNNSAAQKFELIDAATGKKVIIEEQGQEEDKEDNNKEAKEEEPPKEDSDETPAKADIVLPEGEYSIASSASSMMVIDVEWGSVDDCANVQLYRSNRTAAQRFKITYDENGYATITNAKSGKVLDIQWGNVSSGTTVQQYTSNGTMAQKWIIVPNTDGTYTIKSAANPNLVLDLYFGQTTNGTDVQIYSYNGTAAQKFIITSDYPGTSGNSGKGYCYDGVNSNALGITVPADSRNTALYMTEVSEFTGHLSQDGSWEWISASDTTPQRGDIVVYYNPAAGYYGASHVAICVEDYNGWVYKCVDGNYGNEPGGIKCGYSSSESANKGWPDSFTDARDGYISQEVAMGVWRSAEYAEKMAQAAEDVNAEYKSIGQTAFLNKYIPTDYYGGWCYYLIVIAVNTAAINGY